MKRPRFLKQPSSPLPLAILSLVAANALPADQAVFTVGTGGTHSSIQEAVNACPASGCVINLTDDDYNLPREIWIQNKDHLVLQASPTRSGPKPRLHSSVNLMNTSGTSVDPVDPDRPVGWKKWPTSCLTTPGGSKDTANAYSTTGFQHNGMIVIDSSRDVRIEGLVIDGGAPDHFMNKAVWDCKYDIVFGDVGVNIRRSRGVRIRDNLIEGFFAGLYINNRNRGGVLAPAHVDGIPSIDQPGTNPGIMGAHVIEHNVFHHNWWVAYDESEWDLGSTFRFNRALDNRNDSFANSSAASTEASNMAGGFLYVRDVSRAVHRIHNNTVWGSPLLIGHGYFKTGPQHLLYNNIFGGFERLDAKLRPMVGDGRQLLQKYSLWMENNLFALGAKDSLYMIQKMSAGQIDDAAGCASVGRTPPCYVTWDSPVSVITDVKWPWLSWSAQSGAPYTGIFDGMPYSSNQTQNVEIHPGGGFVKDVYGLGTARMDISAAKNRWVKTIPWKSLDSSSADLLVPDWNDTLVKTAVKGQGRASSGWSKAAEAADIGAIPSTGNKPQVLGIRSQTVASYSTGNCWEFPLVRDSVPEGRISSIRAWAVPVAGETDDIPKSAPKSIGISALADSGLTQSSIRLCSPTATVLTGNDVHFVVEMSYANSIGNPVSIEPAYFVVPTYTTVGVGPNTASTSRIRLRRVSDRLFVSDLPGGEFRISLRSLDGRVLRRVAASTDDGSASISLRGIPRGPVAIQIRSGEDTWHSLVPLP